MLEAVMSNAVVSVIRRREVENGQRDEWLRRTRRLRGFRCVLYWLRP